MLAHELAHIRNRDVLVTTIAAMIGAAIAAIANFLQFQWLFGGDDDESPLGLIGTIAAILVAPIAAMLLQFAISRRVPRGPHGRRAPRRGPAARGCPGHAPARCRGAADAGEPHRVAVHREPLSGHGMSSLFSTHPPMAARIERLRAFDAARGL